MIVTLAGHVDHGKTAIVKALTGIDTDRLAEEQARGLTIDLGFAYTDFDDHRIGFVDVPGHHSFIQNMIAGVARMQHALLTVAADDGIMPQTEEHLQILQLLGLESGTVVLNKVDNVDEYQLQTVNAQLRDFLKPTFLSDAPIINTSAKTGVGLSTLRDSLTNSASLTERHPSSRAFRLPVDRVFSRQGLGTIVTGTVYDGEVKVGDDVHLSAVENSVRVRRLIANGLPSQIAQTGDRCGLQIAGVNATEISRGDWLRDPDTAATSDAMTLEFELAVGFPREIKNWCHVHVYHGTAHRLGKLFLLEAPLVHGTKGLVDVSVDTPLHIAMGDRVIIRDQGLDRTIGGGIVIATTAPFTRRRFPTRLQQLKELTKSVSLAEPRLALLEACRLKSVKGEEFRKQWNLSQVQFNSVVDWNTIQQVNNRLLAKSKLDTTRKQLTLVLDEYHAANPNQFGLSLSQIVQRISLDEETVRFTLTHGRNTGFFQVQRGQYASARRTEVTLSYNKDLYARILPLIDTQQPYPIGDIARELRVPLRSLETELKRMLKAKLFVQVTDKRYFSANRLRELADIALALNKSGPFTVKQFRDKCGMGRMICIDVLEHFDKVRFTHRELDTRRVVGNYRP
ncbi:MAG: selenocysteine-specific translation elongation factor [Gammaproteobacteria bacterium]|nr:selenocysteine-specific translation elongation factor [Gammaproteobacteria bacterium]MYC26071.1 selenocysteine-specific translation elongation factor [Gammaproteobacteria bacterium]